MFISSIMKAGLLQLPASLATPMFAAAKVFGEAEGVYVGCSPPTADLEGQQLRRLGWMAGRGQPRDKSSALAHVATARETWQNHFTLHLGRALAVRQTGSFEPHFANDQAQAES